MSSASPRATFVKLSTHYKQSRFDGDLFVVVLLNAGHTVGYPFPNMESKMPTCFVTQPFDGGTYDKQFKDVYEPAIKAAGYEAYRVDQDPSVSVPIDSIEDGIRSATIQMTFPSSLSPTVFTTSKQVIVSNLVTDRDLLDRNPKQMNCARPVAKII